MKVDTDYDKYGGDGNGAKVVTVVVMAVMMVVVMD